MRPYLAIIADAFREALASRVLWVLVIGVTFVLLALAPLGYRTETTTHFLSNGDFFAPRELARKLRQGRLPLPSPSRAVWQLLDEGQRAAVSDLAQLTGDDMFRQLGGLRRALNHVVDSPQLYSNEDWRDARLLPEAAELLADDDALDKTGRQRLHRLLLEGAFPEHFRLRPRETVTITYATLSFPRTWLDETRLRTVIENLVLPVVMQFLLGVIAVLIALLVTSPIIPQMFSAGSLHLLLSKPLSRSLVFLSRFFGGCFFILINAVYLLAGLWLILGLRFGLWNEGLLKCIPLFMFLFMVYYSVAALAGAYWRNAIVAVGVAAGLWGVCFLLGLAKEGLEGSAQRASLRRVIVAGETLLGVSENDEMWAWDEGDQKWEQVFEGSRVIHGPLYSSELAMIVAASGGRAPRFIRRAPQLALAGGRAAAGWVREPLGSLPNQTSALLLVGGELVAVNGDGLHRRTRGIADGAAPKVLGIPIPAFGSGWEMIGASAPTVAAEPAAGEEAAEKTFWQPPLAAAADSGSGDIVVYQRGRVMRFVRAPGEGFSYQMETDTQLDVRPESGAALQCTQDKVIVAVADGRVLELNRENLELLRELRPSRVSQPRFVIVSPDGARWCVVLQNGKVYGPDPAGGLRAEPVPRATAALLTDESLWIASTNRRLTEFDRDGRVLRRIEPPPNNLQRVNRLLVRPLASVLPMPTELNETGRYLLSGKKTIDAGFFEGWLDSPYETLDPWTPVVRCSLFVLVMLLLGCIYIERQEF